MPQRLAFVLSTSLVLPLVVLMFHAAAGQSREEPVTGPVIEGEGPVFEIVAPDFATPTDRDLSAVFDVASSPDAKDRLNPSIVTVARYLNMHARAGVPVERLRAALVLHGGAGKDALDDDAYRERFGVPNPNLPLLRDLRAQGVRVVLCGQTAGFREFGRAELAEPVELALSAMTALVTLQQDGYALIPF